MLVSTIRYLFKSYFYSQRYIMPLISLIVLIGISYTYGTDEVMPNYASTLAVLFIVSLWIGYGVARSESESQSQITRIHIQNDRIYYTAQVICAWIYSTIGSLLAVLYPIILRKMERLPTIEELGMTLLLHIGISLLGIGIALLMHPRFHIAYWLNIIISVCIFLFFLGQGRIFKELPSVLQEIKWILPPIFQSISLFIDYNAFSFEYKILILSWVYIYGFALVCLCIWRILRRRY